MTLQVLSHQPKLYNQGEGSQFQLLVDQRIQFIPFRMLLILLAQAVEMAPNIGKTSFSQMIRHWIIK